jgi:hypothetical protein
MDQTMTNQYYETIIETLSDSTEREKQDWGGLTKVSDMYMKASRSQKLVMLAAMSQILDNSEDYPLIAGHILYLAGALRLTQLEQSIKALEKRDIARKNKYILSQIRNYFGFLALSSNGNGAHQPASS